MRPDESTLRAIAPTGRLRAALNMGNPVLAHSKTSSEQPAGVTIDLARKFAALLGLELELLQFDTPGESGAAIAAGAADIGFLAIDPKRAEGIHFTTPYVQIEGCYLVRQDSPLQHIDEVDRDGTRVVVGVGSAYGLFLARHLKRATLVEIEKSQAVVDTLVADSSNDVAAGVRQQLLADARRVPGVRLLPGAYMTINQAMAMPRGRSAAATQLLEQFISEQRRAGFVQQALQKHGIEGVTVPA